MKRTTSISTAKVSGSALPHALMISLLVMGLLSSMLLLHHQQTLWLDSLYFKELARDNLESGLSLTLNQNGSPIGKSSQALFGSKIDSFHVDCFAWGVYGLANATGIHGPARVEKSVLFSQRTDSHFKSSLLLRHQSQPLRLGGEANLTGPCCVPGGKVERARISSLSFSGPTFPHKNLYPSKGKQFNWESLALADIQRKLSRGPDDPLQPFIKGDSIHQDWKSEALWLGGDGWINLAEARLSGRIFIYGDVVSLPSSASLEHIIVVARTIEVEAGFVGSCQLFASDSILIGEHVTLAYPSSTAVLSSSGQGVIQVQAESVVEGVMINQSIGSGSREAYTLIQNGAKFKGWLIAQTGVDIRGEVEGMVMADQLIYRGSRTYSNHLIGGKISPLSAPCWGPGLLQVEPTSKFIILNNP